MPNFRSIAPTAVAAGSSQRDRFPLRVAVSVLLTAFNAGVIAVSGRTLYLATADHPVWFAGVTALFAALLGSLARSGLSRYAAGLAEAAPPVTQPRKRGESPCNAA
jgi:hypothetical protein